MRRLLILPVLLGLVMLFSPLPAHAFNVFGGDTCNSAKAKDSVVCQSNTSNDPLTGTNGTLHNIAEIISVIAGGAAIIMIIYGSIKYITSGGDANNVKNAKDTVIYALVGLAVIVIARTLIFFVLSKL